MHHENTYTARRIRALNNTASVRYENNGGNKGLCTYDDEGRFKKNQVRHVAV
jgi:hypothetical protein